MGRILASTLIVLLAAACSGAGASDPVLPSATGVSSPTASESPEARISPTTTPTVMPTVAPTSTPAPSSTLAATSPEPPAGLKRVAVIERDGVRVRIELERNPMPAGEWTILTATVRNVGSDVMTWFHDGCAQTVSTSGRMGTPWRLGSQQSGAGAMFKGLTLDYIAGPSPLDEPLISFVPQALAGKGSYGCADIGIGDDIRPGKAITQRFVWEGQAGLRLGPPPSGPVKLTGTFAYYWRGHHEPENIGDKTITVSLDAWITGGADETWLSPPEVVDAALADASFVRYLETQDLTGGRDLIAWYRPERNLWEVGVLAWYDAPTPQLHLVEVDPHTGAVLRTVDRAWDQRLDGFP